MADDNLFFAVKSIGRSTRCGRKPQTLLDAARHNLREIQAEHGVHGRIDPKRMGKNLVMQGPSTAQDVVKLENELYARAGVDPGALRADHCQAIELVFSLPVGTAIDSASYFEKCLQWTCTTYGLPLLLATAHHDEEAGHLHVLLLPLQNEKHVGSKPVSIPTTKVRRESFFQDVAGPYGLKRSNARMRGVVKTWGVEAVLAKIEAEGLHACVDALWPTIQAAIERDPMPALRALEIDINSIRPRPAPAEKALTSNAIGLARPAENPIGFDPMSSSDQNLSSVGFSDERAAVSREALASTHANHFTRSASVQRRPSIDAPTVLPTILADEDGTVRDREGLCQVPDAWKD